MYRGFKLEDLDEAFFNKKGSNSHRMSRSEYNKSPDDNEFYKNGQTILNGYKTNVETQLEKFIIGKDGELDGSAIQNDWFPQIECDIFISHSHKDEKLAIALAGWLNDRFKLRSFIDSCIWEYADDLLKIIDNEYCYQLQNNTYNYKSRNYSTSHVHMMLNMALMKMIDKTECLFFLNTPNSISLSDIGTKTLSPWIYSEIGISQIIERK